MVCTCVCVRAHHMHTLDVPFPLPLFIYSVRYLLDSDLAFFLITVQRTVSDLNGDVSLAVLLML